MHQHEFDYSHHPQLRIGILSDTHAELNSAIERFVSDCDIALHAGDIMAAAPLARLQPRLEIVHAVRGNNDFHATWHPDEHHVLDEIPDVLMLNLPGGKLVMEHSHRVWDRDFSKIHQSLRADYPEADLIVYGHTHIRNIDDSSRPWVVNPGAAGTTRVHDGPSCLELTVNNNEWTIKEHLFSIEKAA